MTNQDKKRYMGQYRQLVQEIGELDAAIKSMENPIFAGCDHSNIVQLIRIMEKQIGKAIRTRIEIENAIERVTDCRLRRLLRLRYIDGLTLERLAEKMDISYQWACQLHGNALTAVKFSDLLDTN